MNIIEKKRNTLFGLDYFDVYGVYAPGQDGGVTADPITFYLPLTASSTTNLPQTITISGSTTAANAILYGKDATPDSWIADNDASCSFYSVGVLDSISASQDTPLTDNTDKSIRFNGGKYLSSSFSKGDYFNIGDSGSMYMEMLVKANQVIDARSNFFSGRASTGFIISQVDNTYWSFFIDDGPESINLASVDGMPAPIKDAWEFFSFCYCAETKTARAWRNGVVQATEQNSSIDKNIQNNADIAIGNKRGSTENWSGSLGYVGFWNPVLTSHEIDTFVAERFQRLCGLYPETAKGTTAPTVTTRASTAVLDKYNSADEKKHFLVGKNWMRLCNRNDSNDVSFTGYLSETAATTLVSNISLPLTGGASVAITGSQTGTFDGATAFRIDEAGTNGSHYVNFDTNTVASDEEYVMSIYASGSGRNVIRMLSPQPAHLPCEAFFVLNGTGSYAVGMGKGSGSSIEACGNGWYKCQVWSKSAVGASAGVDMFVMLVKDDWDQTYQGEAGKGVHIWCPQLELGTVATSPLLSAGSYATRVQDELEFKGDDGNVPKNGIPTKIAISASCLLRDDDQPIYRYLLSVADSYDRLVLLGNQTSGAARFLSYVSVGNDGNALTTKNIQDNTIHDLRASMETGSSAIIADGTHTAYDATADIIDATHQFNEISVGKYATIGTNGLVNKIKIADE